MTVIALVVFYSRHGETERLAFAAGVGAPSKHAPPLRLRRLKDLADATTKAAKPSKPQES